jgi:hypothetical protein
VVAYAVPTGARACFAVGRLGDRIAAVFPLLRTADPAVLSSLTTPYSCLYAPLQEPCLTDADKDEVFAGFARHCRQWAITRLEALDGGWPALPHLVRGARSAGLVPLRFYHFGNWHEAVEGLGWAGYLARRPGALRETIRRRLRQAQQLPDARLAITADATGLDAAIAAFEVVYARSWKEPEPFPAFNAALMRAIAPTGSLRLGVWSIDSRPVAAQFWVVEDRRATVLKLAHDEAFKAHSPGTVLTALMLRHLLDEEGVTEIDFGRGDDAYKQGWAARRRQRIGLLLANPVRLRGLGALVRHGLGRARTTLRR